MNKIDLNIEKLTLKTFLRGFLVVTVFILILIGILINEKPFKLRLREGDIALKPVYAPYDFVYAGPPDDAKTEKERQKVKKSIKEIYSINPQPLADGLSKLDKFFQPPVIGKGISVSGASLKTFYSAKDPARLASETKDLLKTIYSHGIFANKDKARLQEAGEKEIVMLDTKDKTERTSDIESMPSYNEAVRDVYSNAKKNLTDKKTAAAVSELLQNLIAPNVVFENSLTESRRQDVAAVVPVQYQQVEVKKGELIIVKGQRVSKEHIAQLSSLEANESQKGGVKFLTGVMLLVFLLLVIVTIYLILYEPKIFNNTPQLALIGVLSVAIIYIARAIIISPLPSFLIPLASVSMLLAILLNPRLAVFITIILSVAICINVENSLNMFVMFLLGGMVGIFSTRNISRRWQIIMAGILVGIANFAGIITISLFNGLGFDTFITDATWGFINGIVCIFIVMGILPLLEDIFKMTTNITLLELSDMNHPLLKQMMLKAPGTYHHSLMVGNLAEAAAAAVGANPLLARVGAYYHDVGKLEKAEYFTENQVNAKSLHDKLTPSMSRLIITNHVKDGAELGKKYKLRREIIDFIEQHHGTALVYYFFQKALERVEDESILKEEGFRYSGPKPKTKETAIVLLADSAEAASRTLANPTASRIEEMVHRVINNKFIDGQLDDCELTLTDLNRIAQAFVMVLIGVLHTRVEYPNGNENQHN